MRPAGDRSSSQVVARKSWHRWTAICLLAYLYLAVAVVVQRQQKASSGLDTRLIPITVPELLRLLRDLVIPPPGRDRGHRLQWSAWRRRHQYRSHQAHQRWNGYAETTPWLTGSVYASRELPLAPDEKVSGVSGQRTAARTGSRRAWPGPRRCSACAAAIPSSPLFGRCTGQRIRVAHGPLSA